MDEAKSKPLSDFAILAQALVGFAVATLVMLGVGGTVYYLAAPGGWLVEAALGSLVGACFWLARKRIPAEARNRTSELFVYGFAAAGALYFVDVILKGSF